MSAADGRRGKKQRSKQPAAADRERKERDDTSQQPPTTYTAPSAASSSSSAVDDMRAALTAIPSQAGYLILDHQANTVAVSATARLTRVHPCMRLCEAPTLTAPCAVAAPCLSDVPSCQSSGLLSSSSTSAPLFHRLLQDVRGLLDHTSDRGREAVQSVTIDYVTYRYAITITPQYIIAVHITQSPTADTSEVKDSGTVGVKR